MSLFDGLRVVDMGWVWAGNMVGQILADFGAEVIKIESLKHLDSSRQGRPIAGEERNPDQSPGFHNVARGKHSIRVDITTDVGRSLVKQLVAVSDVFIENMTPHALANAQLSYPYLREVNPSLIMVSLPLAGHDGPFRELRGYGPTAGALVGLDSVSGYPGDKQPLGFLMPLGDPTAALHSVLAVLVALHQRRLTGEGQYIETSMWETLATQLAYAVMDYTLNGRIAKPNGTRHPLLAPHGIYPCLPDGELDQWISIAVGSDSEWRSLCEAMQRPALAGEPRFADAYQRQAHTDELDQLLAAWTAGFSPYELMELLQGAGIAAMPCLDQEGRYFNEHLGARECFVTIDHPVLGSEPLYGIPMKLSETPGALQGPAPNMGQHTEEICREILGLSPEQIDELVRANVLY